MPWKRSPLVDWAIVIAVLVVLLLLSVIPYGGDTVGERSRRVKCMNKLRQIGQACVMYAQDFGGWYPTVGGPNRPGRPMASLALLYDRYIDNPKIFVCASTLDSYSDLEPGKTLLPHTSKATDTDYRHCSYAYDDTRGPRTSKKIVIAGDAPSSERSADGKSRNSDNHFGDGQNVLFYGSNTVLWISNTINPKIPGDDIYSAADPEKPGATDSYIHQ